MIPFSCSLTFLFIACSTAEKGFQFLQQKIVKKDLSRLPGKRDYENIKNPKPRLDVSCKSQSSLGLTQSREPLANGMGGLISEDSTTGRHSGMVFFSMNIKANGNMTCIWFAHHMQEERVKREEVG